LIVTYFSIPRKTQQQQRGRLVCQQQRGNRSTLCCMSPNEATKRKQIDVNVTIENHQPLKLLLKGREIKIKQNKTKQIKTSKRDRRRASKSY